MILYKAASVFHSLFQKPVYPDGQNLDYLGFHRQYFKKHRWFDAA